MEKILPPSRNISGLRLTDGEVIGEVVNVTTSHVIMRHPVRTIMGRSPDGSIMLDLVPYTLLAEKLSFRIDTMVCEIFEVDDEIAKKYLEFTTGIAIA